jgi:hypothetical protein
MARISVIQPLGHTALPPYGPTRGMLEGLQLLQRMAPPRVDEVFLRTHKVAPGNEYKVVGALRFLGLIDEQGRPTDQCRLLRTRGPAFKLALQGIIKNAYRDLFESTDLSHDPRDQVYNYFVTKLGLGPEMATKAARFFIRLCLWGEIVWGVAPPRRRGRRPGSTVTTTGPRTTRRTAPKAAARSEEPGAPAALPTVQAPFVFALTPEMARLSEEELANLFRKVSSALRRAFPGAA